MLFIHSGGESPDVSDNVLIDASACQQAEHAGEYGVKVLKVMLWAHDTTVFDLGLDRSMGCVIKKTRSENMTSESSNHEGRRTKDED